MQQQLTRDIYLADPCRTLSIPYFKWTKLNIPPDLQIIHQQNFQPEEWQNWDIQSYFRLYHSLEQIPHFPLPPNYQFASATNAQCARIAELIRLCYNNSTTEAEVFSWRHRAVFQPDLWLLAESGSGVLAGAAIAEFDPETMEASLEWIQVHPDHRHRGLGTALVSALLERLTGIADFATVSGELENPTMPEALYRHCGFSGNDVWYILHQVK